MGADVALLFGELLLFHSVLGLDELVCVCDEFGKFESGLLRWLVNLVIRIIATTVSLTAPASGKSGCLFCPCRIP